MNLAYEQSLVGFDLDLLLETSNDDVIYGLNQNQGATASDKTNNGSQSYATQPQKKNSFGRNKRSEKGTRNLKKKIINTDNLVELYHARCNQVVQLEKNLGATKEKCREACIERDQSRQNFERLEKECGTLRVCIQELQRRLLDNEHMNAATESHTRQLQQLVKQRDTQIEGWRVEKNLKLATIKDLEKKITFFKKHREHLITQICNVADVVFTKRSLTKKEKITLSKYMRLKRQRLAAEGVEKSSFEEQLTESDANDSDNASLSDAEDFTEVTSPVQMKNNQDTCEKLSSEKKDLDGDVDRASESVSVDTGRGSSLASSGSEKYWNSPEYFIDSPKSQSNTENSKPMERHVNSATSPIRMKQFVDMATSPMLFEISCERENNEPHAPKHVKANSTTIVDTATSPMKFPSIVVSRITSIDGIEPISLNSNESCLELNNGIIDRIEPISLHLNESHLELNNSNNLADDNISDCEVEMILNTMKLNDRVITPIPHTPSRPRTNNHCCECRQAAKASEENKALQSAFMKLAAEVYNMKEMIVSLKSNNMVCVDKQPEILEKINSLTSNNMVCVDKQPEIREKINILTSDQMVYVDKQPELREKINSLTSNNMVCVDQPEIREKLDSLTSNNMVCVDKQLEIREKINSLTSNNMVCVDKQPEIRKKINSLTSNNMVCVDKQPEIREKINNLTSDQMVYVDKQPELREKINSLTSNNMVCVDKQPEIREKIDNFISPMVCVDRQLDIREKCDITALNTDNSRSSDIEDQDDSTENNHLFKEFTITDETQECVQTTSPDLIQNISNKLQFDEEIGNLPTFSEVNANNEFVPPELDTAGASLCKKKKKAQKLTRLEKLKKDLIPKSKIKKDSLPPRILRSRIKKVAVLDHNSAKKFESAVTLNNKDVYERAVKVMAEIKSQKVFDTPKSVIRRKYTLKEKRKENINDSIGITDTEKVILRDHIKDQNNGTDHHEYVLVSKPNNNVDVAENNSKNTEIRGGTKRRKSKTPEIEPIITKSRMRYPTVSLTRLTRSKANGTFDQGQPDNDAEVTESDNSPPSNKKCTKRDALHRPEPAETKRILRSSTRSSQDEEKINNNEVCNENNSRGKCLQVSSGNPNTNDLQNQLLSYDDLDLFNDVPPMKKQKCQDFDGSIQNPQESIFCKMIDKFGVTVAKNNSRKASESFVNSINTKITESIASVIELSQAEAKTVMNVIVLEMEQLKFKDFLAGLMQYMMDPTRSLELLSKVNSPPAPPMTKSEEVLFYIVTRAKWDNIDTVDRVLKQIEYVLFRLNQTPEMRVVESMSHFYAILCRYIKSKSRLRIFILNAMYCMQYSAVALIKQCIEVWMHILPLAHMGAAKSPLVTTVVYLLHFYKCDDKPNKVQNIRTILKQKYFFNITDWDETKILEMFRNAILEVKNNSAERKLLRSALMLISKRQGTKWCQNKIINNMLLPLIAMDEISESVKAFCVSMLGPLLKPYPENMKVHCEVVLNKLMDILEKKPSSLLEEATYSSLICLSKHNQTRVLQALLSWRPIQVTPHMENKLKHYVKEKPIKTWKCILSKVQLAK